MLFLCFDSLPDVGCTQDLSRCEELPGAWSRQKFPSVYLETSLPASDKGLQLLPTLFRVSV